MQKGFFLTCVLILCSTGLPAQQNFINVPSSVITGKGKLFYQQQFNFNELIQANSTLDYGLGNGCEAGFNLLGLNYSEKGRSFFNNDTNDRDPYNPLITCNAMKQFKLSENASLGFGGQYGTNEDFDKKRREAGLFYANYALGHWLGEESHLVLGTYYNSRHYGGAGNRLGLWAGAEIPLGRKLHGMVETVIGNNAISYTSLAATYFPKKWLPITLGVQIPNTARNAYSVVMEVTFVP